MRRSIAVFLLTCVTVPVFGAPPPPDSTLLQQAQQANPARYRYAQEQGAKIDAMPDGRSFYLYWEPHTGAANAPLIVTLHGSESWAFDEFFLWHKLAQQHGYRVLALQWWFGRRGGQADYYRPTDLYKNIDALLRKYQARPGAVLLHGFSRGAANSYALAVLDRQAKNNFFGLVVANSGGAAFSESPPAGAPRGFPFYVDITRGRYGPAPFTGTHWALFAGGRDPHPEQDGIPALRRTREWLERFGAKVDLSIEDAGAGHGGFHQSPHHMSAVLDLFGRLRAEQR